MENIKATKIRHHQKLVYQHIFYLPKIIRGLVTSDILDLFLTGNF